MVRYLFMLWALTFAGGASVAQTGEQGAASDGGVTEVCLHASGGDPCHEIGNEVFDLEMSGPDFSSEENEKMAEQAARIRSESPKELEKTIRKMEKK